MKFSRWLLLLAAAPLLFTGCDRFGEAMTSHTNVVARAAGHELTVQEAAQLMAANPEIPADPEIVQRLADVWIDYTLLATAAADDPDLAGISLDKFFEPAREQLLMTKLRERVIQPDTLFSEEVLQQRWAAEGPGAEIRARHILLRVPAEATDAQRDSVRRQAEQLRERAVGGENFATLAEQHSQDPGSAARGGDLGFFSRGRMVAPFEEAAFALQPGEISPVVESPFGLHVIRLEERRQMDLEPQREEFRTFLAQRIEQEAETAYMDSITEAGDINVRSDALPVVREIAANPARDLRGRAAGRVLATYRGGQITSGDFAEAVRTMPPHIQNAFATAPDDQVEGALRQLVQKELLMQEAATHGLELSEAEMDSVRIDARQAIREIVEIAGFTNSTGGASPAVDQQVRELIQGALRGERQLVPLGGLSIALRDNYPTEVNPNSFSQVVAELERIRGDQPAQEPTGIPGGAPMPGGGAGPQMPQPQMPQQQAPQPQTPQQQAPQAPAQTPAPPQD